MCLRDRFMATGAGAPAKATGRSFAILLKSDIPPLRLFQNHCLGSLRIAESSLEFFEVCRHYLLYRPSNYHQACPLAHCSFVD